MKLDFSSTNIIVPLITSLDNTQSKMEFTPAFAPASQMELLKTSVSLIAGKNGEVTMPNKGCILISHSQGKHSFRIYDDVSGNGMHYFVDSQGSTYNMFSWDILDFLRKLFK